MKKLHKQNLIITWCSILALIMVSVLGFGLSVMALKGSIVVIVCGIISTIGYFLPLPDDKKVLMLVFPPAIGTLVYSWITGGNSITYLTNYVLLAMATSYFIESVIIWFAVPFTVISIVFMIFSPETIAGNDYSWAGVVSRVLLFAVTGVLLYLATKRGANVVKKTEKALEQVRQNASVANEISENLNTTIQKSMSSIHQLAEGSSSVRTEATQMGQVVEDTAKSTVTVMDKINAATDEINKNHELATQLDGGFQKVQDAVAKGNDAVVHAKNSILEMEQTSVYRFTAYRNEQNHSYFGGYRFHCFPNESVVSECINRSSQSGRTWQRVCSCCRRNSFLIRGKCQIIQQYSGDSEMADRNNLSGIKEYYGRNRSRRSQCRNGQWTVGIFYKH